MVVVVRSQRRRVWSLMAAAVAIGGLVGASASAQRDRPTEVRVAQGNRTPVPVPLLPDPFPRDENGCLIGEPSPEARDEGVPTCEPTPPPKDAVAPPFDNVSGVYGNSNTYKWVSAVTSEGVIVLPETVTTATDGSWRAWGLVRNETTKTVGSVAVHARLLDVSGIVLDEASGRVVVDPLRPGEPAPFAIDTNLPAGAVADVEWTVTSGSPTGATRKLRVQSGKMFGYGDFTYRGIRPLELNYYRDPPTPPYPEVGFGRVDNESGVAIRSPRVVIAWTDRISDRVLWVTTVPVRDTLSGAALDVLGPGAREVFVYVISDPGLVHRLRDTSWEAWAVGD